MRGSGENQRIGRQQGVVLRNGVQEVGVLVVEERGALVRADAEQERGKDALSERESTIVGPSDLDSSCAVSPQGCDRPRFCARRSDGVVLDGVDDAEQVEAYELPQPR